MQKITPHLWFDQEARQAAEFYTSVFPDSKVTNVTMLHDTPSGDSEIVSFELAGQSFMAISAGPLFKFNPSVSFFVNFDPSRDPDARDNLDRMWERLSEGGSALMDGIRLIQAKGGGAFVGVTIFRNRFTGGR